MPQKQQRRCDTACRAQRDQPCPLHSSQSQGALSLGSLSPTCAQHIQAPPNHLWLLLPAARICFFPGRGRGRMRRAAGADPSTAPAFCIFGFEAAVPSEFRSQNENKANPKINLTLLLIKGILSSRKAKTNHCSGVKDVFIAQHFYGGCAGKAEPDCPCSITKSSV